MLPSRVRQYIFGELCVATPGAVCITWFCHTVHLSSEEASLIVSVGDSLAFMIFLALLDFQKENKKSFKSCGQVIKKLFSELALAEVLDTWVICPIIMWIFQYLLVKYDKDPSAGLLMGKYVSDIFFFVISYTAHRRLREVEA